MDVNHQIFWNGIICLTGSTLIMWANTRAIDEQQSQVSKLRAVLQTLGFSVAGVIVGLVVGYMICRIEWLHLCGMEMVVVTAGTTTLFSMIGAFLSAKLSDMVYMKRVMAPVQKQ